MTQDLAIILSTFISQWNAHLSMECVVNLVMPFSDFTISQLRSPSVTDCQRITRYDANYFNMPVKLNTDPFIVWF